MAHRVLWLVKGLGRGGAERLLTLMAPRVDPGLFEVEVAYLLPRHDAFVDDFERAGIRTVCLDARRTLDLGWVNRLRSLLRHGGYDVVHTHSPVPAAAARMLARDETLLVHTEHNVWERYRWLTYVANAATYSKNATVFAVSDGVADSIDPPRWLPTRNYPPVRTLLHGVDVDDVQLGPTARSEARARLRIPSDAPVIGNVANLTPKKDHLGLIAAVDQLRERFPTLITLFVGSGPLDAELKSEVARRGLGGSIQFLGMRDDVLDILPALDVFVLSSRFEGLPISMLEAMASEIPCVLSRVGGIPEAVTDGLEGRLVEPGQPPALAKAIAELLTAPELRQRMGAAARDRVRADFSIDRAVRVHLETYSTLLAVSAQHSSDGS